MAIETIRDLAFKISISMNTNPLKQADKLVTDFTKSVAKMQQSVSKSMDIVNTKLNGVNTSKAVGQIKNMRVAMAELSNASKNVKTAKVNNVGISSPNKELGTVKSTKNGTDYKRSRSQKRNAKRENPNPNIFGTGKFNSVRKPDIPTFPRIRPRSFSNSKSKVYGEKPILGNPIGLKATKASTIATIASASAMSVFRIATRDARMEQAKMLGKGLETNAMLKIKHREINRTIGPMKQLRDLVGKEKYNQLGGMNGIMKMGGIMAGVSSMTLVAKKSMEMYNRSITEYTDNMNGLVRQETFFANALQFREQTLGQALNTGAKSFEDYKKASAGSLAEARKNIAEVSQSGIVGTKELNMMVGQLASFQIDTDMWFGGDAGRDNLTSLADLMSSIQTKGGDIGEALRVANMIGKSDALGLFGQLQRWGIVLSANQKEIIKHGNEQERLGAIMEGLKQNVGNFNNSMAKTPVGKITNLNNRISESYVKLGEKTIHTKIAFKELELAILPFFRAIVEVGSAIAGGVVKGFTKFLNVISFGNPKIKEMIGYFGLLA
ncbi:MAG: hypothetical protein ACRC6E_03175, partial [Fusobacteriaceae bacterium]